MEEIKKIESFKVDHRFIKEGIYISRIDGDITTYDLRMRKPNTDDLMDNSAIHSFEHMLATFARNCEIKNDIVYVGPMGCQTGFYFLVRNSENKKTIKVIKELLERIISYEGEIFGKSEIECGNFKNLSLEKAKIEAKAYFEKIKDKGEEDLKYPKR